MERAREVIVVGGGVMGLATAYHLARGGHQVLLLEARGIGGGQLARTLADHPAHVPERGLHRAARRVRALGDARRGGRRAAARAVRRPRLRPARRQSHARDAREGDDGSAGVAHESIDAAEIRRRFPQLTPPDDAIGLYQPDYAMLPADQLPAAARAGARAAGAELREHEACSRCRRAGSGVEVRTARDDLPRVARRARARVVARPARGDARARPAPDRAQGAALALRARRPRAVRARPASRSSSSAFPDRARSARAFRSSASRSA